MDHPADITHDHAHRDRESGIAMVTAILVIAVLSLVAILAVQLSLHNQGTSNLDRKRTQAVSVAEAGVDLAYKELSTTNLKCDISGTLPTKPTTSSYTAKVTYYSSYPGDAASNLSSYCTGPSGAQALSGLPSGVYPQAAQINVVGTTNAKSIGGDRQLQTLVKLNPITTTTGFNKAIFANGTLNFANNTTLYGNVGNDADVYSNSAFNCTNSLNIAGSVFTQSSAVFGNSCSIAGDVYAKFNITTNAGANGTVGHDAKSSQGSISITSSPFRVTNNAVAKLTVSAATTANVGNQISQGATIPDPPYLPFPVVKLDSPAEAAWNAAGFAVSTNNTCSGGSSVYNEIAAMSTATAPKAIKTTCLLAWSNNSTVTLAQDLAIFSTGGFAPTNRFEMKSSVPGVKRKVYWVVPYDAASIPCTSPSIQTTNLTKFTDVQTFMYTPCNVAVNNNTSTSGQIYSGSNVTTANLFTLAFVPLPVWGANGGDPSAPTGYKVDIAYKREVKKTS